MRSDIGFIARELAALARMDEPSVRAWYAEVFRDATTTRNAASLRRRLAWWIQWQAEDRLPEHIWARIAELPPAARTKKVPRTRGISRGCARC